MQEDGTSRTRLQIRPALVSLQVSRSTDPPTSPFTQRGLVKPSLRSTSLPQARAAPSRTSRSSTTTTTRILFATPPCSRSEVHKQSPSSKAVGGCSLEFSDHQGNMAVAVCHGGDPIPKSPFHILVAPLLDLSKISIQGLNSSEYFYANFSPDCMSSKL